MILIVFNCKASGKVCVLPTKTTEQRKPYWIKNVLNRR
jgi:hypothetical protein